MAGDVSRARCPKIVIVYTLDAEKNGRWAADNRTRNLPRVGPPYHGPLSLISSETQRPSLSDGSDLEKSAPALTTELCVPVHATTNSLVRSFSVDPQNNIKIEHKSTSLAYAPTGCSCIMYRSKPSVTYHSKEYVGANSKHIDLQNVLFLPGRYRILKSHI